MLIEPIQLTLSDGRNVEFRSPRTDEASSIISAMINIAESSPYILSTADDFRRQTIEHQTKWIETCTQSKSAVIIACYFGEEIVGLCNAQSYKDSKRKHRAALGISIHPEFRSVGLGRKLTETLLESIKRFEDIKIIELDVMSANTNAIKLYESFGFKRSGLFPIAYFLPNGEKIDNISMYLEL